MAEADFFSAATAPAIEGAVREVELQSAAELVVAARRNAGTWRVVDVAVGAGLGFVAILLLLFHPYEFSVAGMPLGVLLSFALGMYVSSSLWGLKRRLLRRSKVDKAVANAAKAAFVDLGVSATRGRTGVLVVFFLLERRVELVADLAVDVEPLGAVRAQLQAAFERLDFAAFVTALKALGPPLGKQLPRSDDDVNELPDSLVVDGGANAP